jgi:hypothetical protein
MMTATACASRGPPAVGALDPSLTTPSVLRRAPTQKPNKHRAHIPQSAKDNTTRQHVKQQAVSQARSGKLKIKSSCRAASPPNPNYCPQTPVQRSLWWHNVLKQPAPRLDSARLPPGMSQSPPSENTTYFRSAAISELWESASVCTSPTAPSSRF